MKVKELIELLQECNQEKELTVENDNIINGIQELFFSNEVVIFTAPKEEIIEEEESAFFLKLAEELEQAEGEYMDALKINGVR